MTVIIQNSNYPTKEKFNSCFNYILRTSIFFIKYSTEPQQINSWPVDKFPRLMRLNTLEHAALQLQCLALIVTRRAEPAVCDVQCGGVSSI